jgi:hypothetical protein
MTITKVKTEKVTPRVIPKVQKKAFALGVIWDEFNPKVQSSITRDLIAMKDVYGERLRVVCAGKEISSICSALGLNCTPTLSEATTWKAYIVRSTPELPDSAEQVYYTHCGQPVNRLVMRPNDPRYTEHTIPGDNRMVPNNMTLNLLRRPPRTKGPNNYLNNYWYLGM